jgi:hypothetical protein
VSGGVGREQIVEGLVVPTRVEFGLGLTLELSAIVIGRLHWGPTHT